jgi:hypothetical protein
MPELVSRPMQASRGPLTPFANRRVSNSLNPQRRGFTGSDGDCCRLHRAEPQVSG